MKKFLLFLVLAGVGYYVWKSYVEADGQRDVWSQVTDKVG